MADNVPESLEQLRSLHPQSANSLNSCHKNNVFSRTSNPVKWLEVEAALKSFKTETAAGPSGLDVQFLREALQCGVDSTIVLLQNALCALVWSERYA